MLVRYISTIILCLFVNISGYGQSEFKLFDEQKKFNLTDKQIEILNNRLEADNFALLQQSSTAQIFRKKMLLIKDILTDQQKKKIIRFYNKLVTKELKTSKESFRFKIFN